MEAYLGLSRLLLRGGRFEEVVNLLWPAVQQAPREASGPLRFFLGVATAAQQQHDVAEPLFEQVLTLEPTFVEAWLSLAAAQAAQGKVGPATEALEQAATLRPELREYVEREKAALHDK